VKSRTERASTAGGRSGRLITFPEILIRSVLAAAGWRVDSVDDAVERYLVIATRA